MWLSLYPVASLFKIDFSDFYLACSKISKAIKRGNKTTFLDLASAFDSFSVLLWTNLFTQLTMSSCHLT